MRAPVRRPRSAGAEMSGPTLAGTREELSALLAPARAAGLPVGLVPTMGALHAGHASLLRTARAAVGDGPVVASVFVNPLQFGAGEDLDRYPRTLDADLAVCAAEGVDVVFAPSVDEVYPSGAATPGVTVEPGPLGTVLEGAVRPGHFRGVLTVVAKLFGLVEPDVAVFGLKDFQQFALISRMVADLCLDVEVLGADTVREPDGLALSSRNRFLDAEQRRQALVLSRALRAAQAARPRRSRRGAGRGSGRPGDRAGGRGGLPRGHRDRPGRAARRGTSRHPGPGAGGGPAGHHPA